MDPETRPIRRNVRRILLAFAVLVLVAVLLGLVIE